jgi:hypothetical protein
VVLYEHDLWRLVRHLQSGYLGVHRRDDELDSWSCMPLDLHWRKNTYALAAAAGQSGLYIVGYDTVANVPSGRSLVAPRSGVDVFLVSNSGCGEQPVRLAGGLQIGGLDSVFVACALPDGVVIAGERQIVTVCRGSPPRFWNLHGLGDREFVEVWIEGERAAAIVRSAHDDRSDGPISDHHATFELVTLEPDGMTETPVHSSGIPWRVRIGDRGAICDYASSPEELSALFLHDLGRMGFDGILNFGGNNLEGRVAWSQSYYLDALLELRAGRLRNLDFSAADLLEARIVDEVRLLVDLALSEWPGLRCQRYSVDREPLLYALHAGRVLGVLAKASARYTLDPAMLQAIESLRMITLQLSGTVEAQGEWIEGHSFRSLGYRRGVPFWADGSNVPYNYVSGVVAGILSVDSTGPQIERCAEWMRPLLRLEFSQQFPNVWRYWWGPGDRGWAASEGVSLNTPHYPGNGGALAHITYRSMDAIAMIFLERRRPGSLPSGLSQNLRRLIEHGWLLPWVAGVLPDDHRRPTMKPEVVRRHARAAAAWELQAQIWALDQLAGEHMER